jgi:GDP-4-dehydro-6-deoxy-D-mannose reductase
MVKQRVLITGVTGFLGQAFYHYLRLTRKRCTVYGMSRRVPAPSRFIFYLNCCRTKLVRAWLDDIRPGYIYHFAGGRTLYPPRGENPNVSTTRSLFEAVAAIPGYAPRIFIPGSAAEYGRPAEGIRRVTEKAEARPVSPYGKAKLAQTELALAFAEQGVDVVIGRIFNVSGKGTPAELASGRFAKSIVDIEQKSRKLLLQTLSLDGQRDFMDIQDVCAAIDVVSRAGQRGKIYNICSGQKVLIRDLLRRLLALSRTKHIVIDEQAQGSTGSFDVIGSNVRLKKLGWRPRVTFDDSLKQTLAYYRRKIKA